MFIRPYVTCNRTYVMSGCITEHALYFLMSKSLMNAIVIMIVRKFSKMDVVMKDLFRSSTNSHHYPKYRRSRMLVHNAIRPGRTLLRSLRSAAADLKMKFGVLIVYQPGLLPKSK